MEKIHRDILRDKRAELDDLDPAILLKHMAKVLKPDDEEKIKAQSTRAERVDKLLEILPIRGEDAFDCLLKALKKEQRHLADLLRKAEVKLGRISSANLRLQLSETKKELESEKEKNLAIQIENEKLKRIQDEQLNKLYEQILKTEDNLKQHFEDVLERKAQDIAATTHVPVEHINSRRSSLNEILQLVEKSGRPEEDENGNILADLEKLNMELNRCHQRESKLDLECKMLRDQLKSLHVETEDSKTCKKCEILGKEHFDQQKKSTEEIQRLKNATMEYKDKIKTLQDNLSAQQSLNEQSKENCRALDERFKTLLDGKQTELRRLKNEAEKSKKKTESDGKKLAVLRQNKQNLQEENKQLLEEKKTTLESIKEEKTRSEKEMAGLRKIASKVQKECQFLETELRKWKSLPGKVLNFYKAFDRNGVIYTLSAKNQNFSLAAKRSSDAHGHAMDILNHSTGTHSGTENKEHSWWQIDLGEEVLVYPNHYALRHGSENGLAVISNWKLEGSRDGENWKVLREHNQEKWFKKSSQAYPFYTGSWAIEGPIDAIRYLRVYQTGKNSAGGYALYLSGIEVYGVLLHMCDGD